MNKKVNLNKDIQKKLNNIQDEEKRSIAKSQYTLKKLYRDMKGVATSSAKIAYIEDILEVLINNFKKK